MNFSFLTRRVLQLSLSLLAMTFITPNTALAKAHSAKKSNKAQKIALTSADNSEYANFTQWKEVAEFINYMVTIHGFDKLELEAMLRKTRYIDRAIKLIKPAPPGQPKNWTAYRIRFVEPVRINAGVMFWDKHADALARAEEQYGVPAEIIIGILGVETIYGRNTGSFRVMDAITTLAFAYPNTPTRATRMAYFKGELENTLLFARETQIDPFTLLGSYAGAIGLPQFMPGSIRKFAVDFDGDGKIDLRNSPVDAIGSIASFLVQHGWQRGAPIVFPTNVTPPNEKGESAWNKFIGDGLVAKFSLSELKEAGVVPDIEPPAELSFGLVDLQNGLGPTEYWLGASNFFALTQYNRSFFYAMSVVDLSNAVKSARMRY